ncbi:MAG: hypothetical protein H0W21_01775 [Actinobacteria bacterium]|nr:hypothetical protein [Actinomycetota bacterium]
MEDRELATLLGWTRIGVGAAFVMAPAKTSKLWMGENVDSVFTRMAGRTLGARDLALGVGLLTAIRRDSPARGWLEAGVLADSVDTFSATVGLRRLPKIRSLLFIAAGAGSVVAGRRLTGSGDLA